MLLRPTTVYTFYLLYWGLVFIKAATARNQLYTLLILVVVFYYDFSLILENTRCEFGKYLDFLNPFIVPIAVRFDKSLRPTSVIDFYSVSCIHTVLEHDDEEFGDLKKKVF